MLAKIRIGNTVTLTAELLDGDDAAGIPQAVRCRVRHESEQADRLLSVGPVADGRTSATFTPDRPGQWFVRVETDGPDCAAEGVIVVHPSKFSNPS